MIAVLAILWGLADAGPAPASSTPAESLSPTADVSALSFTFEGCADRDAREIERLLRGDIAWAPGDPTLIVCFRCQAAGVEVALTSDDNAAGVRFVSLVETALDARPRTVALIAAEMILDGRRHATAIRLPKARERASQDARGPAPTDSDSPTPAVAPPGAPSARATVDAATVGRTATRRRIAVLAFGGASLHHLSSGVPVFELGGRARLEAPAAWGASIDVGIPFQSRTLEVGTARAVGGDLVIVGEARADTAAGTFGIGAGARAIALRVSASTDLTGVRPSHAWGAALGPIVRLRATWRWRRLVSELAIDGGWIGPDVAGVVRGAAAVGVGAWWAGLSLALGGRATTAAASDTN